MLKSVDAKLMSVVWHKHKPKRAKPRVPDFVMQYKLDQIKSVVGMYISAVSVVACTLLGLLYLFIVEDKLFSKILFCFGAVFLAMIWVCKVYADFWKEKYDEIKKAYDV